MQEPAVAREAVRSNAQRSRRPLWRLGRRVLLVAVTMVFAVLLHHGDLPSGMDGAMSPARATAMASSDATGAGERHTKPTAGHPDAVPIVSLGVTDACSAAHCSAPDVRVAAPLSPPLLPSETWGCVQLPLPRHALSWVARDSGPAPPDLSTLSILRV